MRDQFTSANSDSIEQTTPHTNVESSDNRTTPTVVICGSLHQDTIVSIDQLPSDGGTFIVDDGIKSLGGKGANQAVAISRDDVHAVMTGTVGEDRAADAIIERLNAEGVDVHAIATSWDRPTGSAFIATDNHGKPAIFVQRGADALTDPTDFTEEMAQADIVLAQGELLPQATEAIASVAAMTGARFVLNLNPVTVATPALIDAADPLIVNRAGAWETLKKLGAAEGIRGHDLRGQIVALLQYAPSVVILLGEQGCIYAQEQPSTSLDSEPVVYYQPAVIVPKEKFIDATGSGDAFVGTLTAELARGASFKDAVALATCAGAAAVQAFGACTAFAFREKLLEMVAAPELKPAEVLDADATLS